MTEPELAEILKSLDTAIAVYRNPKGILSAAEISVKTMLMVLHAEVVDQLQHERSGVHAFSQGQVASGQVKTDSGKSFGTNSRTPF